MKKTSTSTETRSSSSESTHSSSSSSQSQEKTFPGGDANPQPSNSTPVNTPVALGTDSEHQAAHPAFDFSEGQWDGKRGKKAWFQIFSWSPGSLGPVRDSSLLFLSCPWQLSASGSIAWTSARLPKLQHAAGAATVTSVSINQSSLAIAYIPFSFSLTSTHRLYQSGTGPGKKSPASQIKKKGCPTAPSGADRQCRDIFSLVRKKSQLSPSAPFTFVFVHASRGFKGKVVVFTPRMLCTFVFLSRGELRNATCSVT